jgi:hypothetical protein
MADQDAYDVSPDDALEETRHKNKPYRYFVSRRSPYEDDDTGQDDDFGDEDDDTGERPWHLNIYNEKGDVR